MRKLILACTLSLSVLVAFSHKDKLSADTYNNNAQVIHSNTNISQKEVECLARNIYFESAAESRDGKIAVALVTLNRVNDGRWPTTVCGVVNDRNKHVCQFSWVCQRGDKAPVPRTAPSFLESEEVAELVLRNYARLKDITLGATHYHANYVRPSWAKKQYHTITIGNHVFYRL